MTVGNYVRDEQFVIFIRTRAAIKPFVNVSTCRLRDSYAMASSVRIKQVFSSTKTGRPREKRFAEDMR